MIRRETPPDDADEGDMPSLAEVPGCQNCRFWRRAGRDGPGPDWGQCKRMPPVLPEIEPEKMVHVGIWPSTEAKDWCGEWQTRGAG
jgi:hypothetical protein